ncbi:TetR/AcrR family transcriptional regulator [Nocardiopsis halophila]|uniref:TetR/AcrR family transcriptional regulator n=1 Tax=Nocardiopsis halophila TaxID=141692 RepID=UPI00036B8B30|nr:TetR/AcrR family transcriptional regulator [Nocardiopsis halophila]
MARRRVHSDDAILDAARDLLVHSGPEAATTGAISARSGAPVGSLYHRFGSRGRIFAEVWLRTVRRFQEELQEELQAGPPADGAHREVERALAVADRVVDFAVRHPEDARLLLEGRREELVAGADLPEETRQALAGLNRPVARLLEDLAAEVFGAATPQALEAVTIAVVDVPYAVVRRHLRRGTSPGEHRALVAQAARALLQAPGVAVGDGAEPGKNLRAHRDT